MILKLTSEQYERLKAILHETRIIPHPDFYGTVELSVAAGEVKQVNVPQDRAKLEVVK